MKIKFYWNGSFLGSNYSMKIDDNEIHLGLGCVSEESEAKKQIIKILKSDYNLEYTNEDIKFEWGGRL